jgi:predicted transcriptional regulator
MNQPISSLMQRAVHTVGMDDTVAEVETLFAAHDLSWAPVMDSDRTAIGVISSADLLKFHAQGRNPQAVAAWQLCSYKPIAVGIDVPVHEVARLMVDQHVHHVVVTEGAAVAGVVSSLDFVRTFMRA